MNPDAATEQDRAGAGPLEVKGAGGVLCIGLGSGWDAGGLNRRVKEAILAIGRAEAGSRVDFEDAGLDRSDAVVVSTVLQLIRVAEASGHRVELGSLPDSIRPLLKLALAVPLREPEAAAGESWISRIGRRAVESWEASRRFIEFLGELIYSFGQLLIGKSRFRWRDFWVILQDCGAGALPIVSLLALLTGTILGFIGAVQLRKFGATIYMTDLVGLAMAREMGCLMTGIIMAGRTGAAFAAQIGSMNVNEEVDALRTVGLSPVEFLVLPRTLALVMMMPLLTIYANVLGWIGGFLVAIPMDLNAAEYWNQLIGSTGLEHILFGLSKSFFFGIVVATCGCYYGLRSGRSSAAVGTATTRAVVAGITWIVVLDAVFAFMDEALKNGS